MAVRELVVTAAVGAGAACADAAGDDVDLVGGQQRAEIVLQRRPRTLIVVGGLRHHVRHQERRLIDRDGRFLVAVRVGHHVAAVEAAVGEVERLHAIPVRRHARDRDGTCRRASACRSTRRTDASSPSSAAEIAVVRERELRLLHQDSCSAGRRSAVAPLGLPIVRCTSGGIGRRGAGRDRERPDVVRRQRVRVRRRVVQILIVDLSPSKIVTVHCSPAMKFAFGVMKWSLAAHRRTWRSLCWPVMAQVMSYHGSTRPPAR